MNLLKHLKLAFNILIHSKLRSWLSIIGIVIGVASVIAILALGEGLQQQLEESLGGLGADIITVSPGAERAFGSSGGFRRHSNGGGGDSTTVRLIQKNITNRDVQALKLVPNVAYIGGVVSGREPMGYLRESTSVSITGVDTKVWKYMINTELDSGRLLSQGDINSIVVGYGIAKNLFEQNIQINRPVTINGKSFRVVGILEESTGFGSNDRSVYMPIEMAREVLDNVGAKEFNSISIKVKNVDILEETVEDITKKLMLVRAVTERTKDFTVTSVQATQETISEMLSSMTLFLGAIAAISLLVGAIGIANTMFTTVLEKTKEIGIMKAVGAKNMDISLIFLFNSGMIGMAGGILGGAIGIYASSFLIMMLQGGGGGMLSRMGSQTIIDPQTIALVVGFSILIGLISGLIPAYRASKMNPVDALRYE